MSHALENDTAEETPAVEAAPTVPANQAVSEAEMDALENVDFLLEEIENKIAPLALA
ncbi:MAG: ammosamide/lymphostin RiPP family protein [Myxococcota bacterium]|nr:ammosamide/lymphostin RiPP family protein [Myxococcota bacterium]